jgi:broad-specificity NMP kinase
MPVILITGIQAAGKSSVVQAVAERLDRSVHRHLARGKTAYKPGDEGPAELDAHLRRETPRIGLWLDTSAQTLEQTTEELLARVWAEGRV